MDSRHDDLQWVVNSDPFDSSMVWYEYMTARAERSIHEAHIRPHRLLRFISSHRISSRPIDTQRTSHTNVISSSGCPEQQPRIRNHKSASTSTWEHSITVSGRDAHPSSSPCGLSYLSPPQAEHP